MSTIIDDDTAYALGQIMALLAYAGAFEDEHRAMQRAYLSPASVIPAAIARLMRQERGGKRGRVEERIEELMAEIEEIPNRPVPLDGGLFDLGYWHEKARLRGGRPKRPEGISDAILTERLVVPIDPDLKAWAMQHGGAGLVRRLLETERRSQS